MKIYNERFIAVEGVDGSGKTTFIQTLKAAIEAHLGNSGTVEVISAPRGCQELTKQLTDVFTGNSRLSPFQVEIMMQTVMNLLDQRIQRLLEDNPNLWIISDRWRWSNVVYGFYQLEKLGQDGSLDLFKMILDYNVKTSEMLFPDLVFYMDTGEDEIVRRLSKRENEAYDSTDVVEILKKKILFEEAFSYYRNNGNDTCIVNIDENFRNEDLRSIIFDDPH